MRRKRGGRRSEVIKDPEVRVNEEIDAKQVRLLNEEGIQVGILPTKEALQKAFDAELDLVEISQSKEIPVCRIIDYSKYIFDIKKRKSQAKKNQKQIEYKTIKFRPNTNQGDYDIKIKKILEFLEKGHRIKIIIWFKGREMMHQELGQTMLEKIKTDLTDTVRIDDEPKLEGRQMQMAVSPLSIKKS